MKKYLLSTTALITSLPDTQRQTIDQNSIKTTVYKNKMIKTIYLLLFLVVLSVPNQAIGQEKSTSSLLVGTWIFDYDQSVKNMETSSKVHLDSVAQDRKERIEKSYKGRLVTFSDVGSYEQSLADGRITKGTWGLSKNKKSVIITDPNGNKYTQKIKLLSDTQLVLKPVLEGKAKMLISEWNFIKSKN